MLCNDSLFFTEGLGAIFLKYQQFRLTEPILKKRSIYVRNEENY